MDDVSFLHQRRVRPLAWWGERLRQEYPGQGPCPPLETNGGPHLYGRNGHSRAKGSRFKENAQEGPDYIPEPSACLNPRRTVRQILMEPFEIHGMKGKMDVEARIVKLPNLVGLDL